MKIPLEKQVAFLEKVIPDTRFNSGAWQQQNSDSVAACEVFRGISLDREGVFSYTFPQDLKGEFWVAMGCDEGVLGAIGTDYRHMEWFDHSNETIKVLLTRLFYLLFDRRPNANKLIDAYLGLGPGQQQDNGL